MKVVINHKYPPFPVNSKTKCGNFNSFGAVRRPGSKWFKSQTQIWPAVFEQGETMPLDEFQSRYFGLLRAVGFQSNYAKKMATLYHIDNGLVQSGVISLVNK